MEQRPTGMTVEPGPPRRALRTVLRTVVLLGGTVVAWLLLSGTPAHADETRPADGSGVAVAVAETVTETADAVPPAVDEQQREPVGAAVSATSRTVQTATRIVGDTVRRLPATTEQALTDATAPAPQPVRSALATVSTVVTPVLTSATTVVADTVDCTSLAVQGVLEPLVTPATATAAPTSAALLVMHSDRWMTRPDDVIEQVAASVPAQLVQTMVAELGRTAHDAWSDASGVPVPDAPVLPSSSVGSWSGAAAALFGLLLLLPLMSRRRFCRDVALLPLGPAYPPGSSPD